MRNFRTFNASVSFFKLCKTQKIPAYLKDQLNRASSSICLNLSEGYGRMSFKDKRKFYRQAMGSLRECQAILEISEIENEKLINLADYLGACLYKLVTWVP